MKGQRMIEQAKPCEHWLKGLISGAWKQQCVYCENDQLRTEVEQYKADWKACTAMNRELLAEVERMRVDAERLNFIQANPKLRLCNYKRRWALVGLTNYEYDTFKTVREAIDAAIGETVGINGLTTTETDATASVMGLVKQEQAEPVWKDIDECDGYEVSSHGDVRNKKTGKILAKNLMGAGYVKADMWLNGKRKQTSVHRLVATAFLGPSEGREVNHKNGDKQDNRVENLEWCSRSDNVNHNYYKLGALIKPIKITNIETGEVLHFPSCNEATRHGFKSARIHECLSGKRDSYGGFMFEYDTAPQGQTALLKQALKALQGTGTPGGCKAYLRELAAIEAIKQHLGEA
jgi:hypothetical protein